MKNNKSKKISLIKDLMERRVPQIIGIYLTVSWGIIQFIIWLVGEFMLSPYLPQFAFVLLLSLLPTAYLLAYFHGRPGRDKWVRTEKIGIPLNLIFTLII